MAKGYSLLGRALARQGVDTAFFIMGGPINDGVKAMIRQTIEGARRNRRHVGICGQAPSDYPEMAEYLVELGIDSISVTPDTLLAVTRQVLAVEARLGRIPRVANAAQEST